MHKTISLICAAALLALPGFASAHTFPLTFDIPLGLNEDTAPDDVGDVFTDPFGHTFDSEFDSPITAYEFQMATDLDEDDALPIAYQGPPSATDFHLWFNVPFVSWESLAFTHYDGPDPVLVEWEMMVSDDMREIWFLAPGVTLDPGEMFEIEVEELDFGQDVTDTLRVKGTWTGINPPGENPIPEPTAGLVFGLGAALMGARVRRRS